jgi:hypothetical protein
MINYYHRLYTSLITTQVLKGTKGNEGNNAVEFPYFLHFPVKQADE